LDGGDLRSEERWSWIPWIYTCKNPKTNLHRVRKWHYLAVKEICLCLEP
jgi:hypothetical protein